MDLKNKKFLVTGGAGFIGSHTVDALIKRGAEVAIIDNLITGRKENLPARIATQSVAGGNPEANFYNLNIANPKVEKVFQKEKPEFIYHFAFNVLVPKSVGNPLMDMDSIAGAINIFQNAKKYGVRKIIFSSSGFLYGNTENLPAKETEPVIPVSPYIVSKRAVENYLEFYKTVFNLAYVILRYSAVYGPRQRTGAMADYIRKLAADKQAEMYGDGEKTRDYIYIEDVIRANLLALEVPPDFSNPVFNIGTGIETTLNDLYKKIAEILSKEANPIYLPDRPGEQYRYSINYSKAKKELGWEPKIDLEEGLKRRIEYYKQNFK